MKNKLRKELNKLFPDGYKHIKGTRLRLDSLDERNGIAKVLVEVVKTPPKQPIFQIDGKDMFEGDEYWWIYKDENWKLYKSEVRTCKILNSSDYPIFVTKQDALNYVLEEAKSRFEGCKRAKWFKQDIRIINSNLYINPSWNGNNEAVIVSNNNVIWREDKGFIAEPIKNNLMLGDEVVKIKPSIEGHRPITIHCKGESVTKEQWMEWYDNLQKMINSKCNFEYLYMSLSSHSIDVDNTGKELIINIAQDCPDGISNVTIEQIEAITKELEKI